ncbi:MAG: site-specific integrase [Bacteroidetes bacterium]|nr:site-specific integrase [Bacteroidota bacterium]
MITTKAVLYKTNKKLDGTCPLAIRVTKNRKPKYIFLGHFVKEKNWDPKNSCVKKAHANSARLNNLLKNKVADIDDVILEHESQNKELSINQIKKIVNGESKDETFFSYAETYFDNLFKAKKYNRWRADKPRVNNLKKFLKGEETYFHEIDVALLKKFRAYLSNERKVTERTIMNHYVVIRTLFNSAITDGVVDRKYYPFGKDKIKIKFPETIKIGLVEEDIRKIEELDLKEGSMIWHTRNVYMYSFYFAGMRLSDALRSKWSDFKNGRFYYKMGKNNKVDSIKVSAKVLAILDHYEKDKQSNDDYIFPELKKTNPKDPQDENRKINTSVKKFNKYLKRISEQAEINKKITNHIARHSFGNIAGDKVSPQMLQKLYRHTDIKTTMGYQANFIHKSADEALDAVLDF